MEKCSKKDNDVTDLGHCIIKEELIIPDEEIKVEKVDEEIDDIQYNIYFFDSQAKMKFDEQDKPNETLTKRKRGRPRTKISSADNEKRRKLDVLVKSEIVESNDEQSENHSGPTIKNEKPIIAVTKEHDIGTLAKKVAKAYCKKCRQESEAVRQKARCDKCNIPFSYTCHTCDRTYNNFINLSFHLKTKHIEAHLTYLCSICNQTFNNNKLLLFHRRTKHKVYESRECSKCGKEFGRSVNKLMHEKFCGKYADIKCEKTNLYKCDTCSYTTREKKVLKRHHLEKHTEGFKAECKSCPKVFKNVRSLRRHVLHYCNKPKKLECHHCGHKVYRKDEMVIHLDQNHMKGYYTEFNVEDDFKRTRICEYCGVILAQYERMKYHRMECNSSGSHSPVVYNRVSRICKYCGETLNPREQMRSHVKRCESAPLALHYTAERAKLPDMDTVLKELAISYCVKCQTKEPLKHRVRRCGKCNKLLRYSCVSCPKNFVVKYHLQEHLKRKHLRTLKFYRCNDCRCLYSDKHNLIAHIRNNHSDQLPTTNLKCEKCGKECKSETNFRAHKIKCGQEPKFHCDKCPYKTHYKSSIIKHIWAKRSTCFAKFTY